MNEFTHPALNLMEKTKVVFIAMSKKSFYFKDHAIKYVLEQGHSPISQFGIFHYFLLDTVDRNMIRKANNNLIRVSDEMWVFGPISDGVLAEIKICEETNKPVKYFKIINSKDISEIKKESAELE